MKVGHNKILITCYRYLYNKAAYTFINFIIISEFLGDVARRLEMVLTQFHENWLRIDFSNYM